MEPDDSSAPPPPLRIGLPSRLGEMLIRQGLVTSDDVQAALAEQAAGSEWRLGRLLVRRGALDDRTLVQAIAHQFHVPVVDLRVEPPTPRALAHLSRDAAMQLQALPLRIDADALVVAVADPPVRELRVAVERSTGLPVRLVLVAADELADGLADWYSESLDLSALDFAAPDLTGANGADPFPPPGGPPITDGVPEAAPVETPEAAPIEATEAAPIEATPIDDATDLQIVVWLLTESVRRGATTVHLDHGEDGLRVRYRVDGALVPGPVLPRASGTVVCHRLLASADLDPVEDGFHEGAFDTVVDGRSMTCRVTAVTTSSGTHVVVRTQAAARAGRLEDLRIGADDAAAVRRVLADGRGVVLVATSRRSIGVAISRTLVDELGPDEHVVVMVQDDQVPAPAGVVTLVPDRSDAGEPARVIRTARALGADLVVVDRADAATMRAAFDAASGRLVVVRTEGSDPSDVAADLVGDVGGFLVAGMLRVVLVGSGDGDDTTAEVHVVTEDVCRAILDLPPAG